VIADAINGAILRLYTALKSEDGQTFVEYSLIGVLVALGLVIALGTFSSAIGTALGNIGHELTNP
jgi:Flp pilus assembly pilin Flp